MSEVDGGETFNDWMVVSNYVEPYVGESRLSSHNRPAMDLELRFEKTVEMSSLWFRFECDMDGWKKLSLDAHRCRDEPGSYHYLGYYKRSKEIRKIELRCLTREMNGLQEV